MTSQELQSLKNKYDITLDDQKVRYVHEAAELISTLPSSIQREVYGGRVAQIAGISIEAMKLEIGKAYKRRIAKDQKEQEKIDLAPARNLQPKVSTIRYNNMKSAMAEEGVIALALLDPSVMAKAKLTGEHFSVPLLGKVYDQLLGMYKAGCEVSIASLSDITQEEMSHITGISQKQQGPVNETAIKDCVRTILMEHQTTGVSTEDDLMKFREQLKERKGIK